MKRARLLNSDLSRVISRLGHTDSITVGDAGLPIPASVERIDLAIEQGYPSFVKTLDAMLSEMQVEEIVVARELRQAGEALYREVLETLAGHSMAPRVIEVEHEAFKAMTLQSLAVVRTGECTPYANVILRAGVTF